jgi:fumarate reductase subunit D
MSSETRSRGIDSDLQVAQYLTIGMNAVLVLAVLALALGVALGIALLVVATLSVFVIATIAYVITHVVLHQRVAAARERGRERATIRGALGLIKTNLLLYGAFVLAGLAIVFSSGYL